MATLYRCDRCPFESKERGDVRPITLPVLDYNRRYFRDDHGVGGKETTKELCASCMNEMHETLKPPAVIS